MRIAVIIATLLWSSLAFGQGINNPCGNTATSTVPGCVKPDGTTITNTAGAISVTNPATTVGTATVGQIPGTTTNDDAGVGKVGEFLSTTVTSGSAVALTSGVPITIVSKAFTAGDWDLTCDLYSIPAASTVAGTWYSSISLVTNTLDVSPGALQTYLVGSAGATPAGGYFTMHIGPFRASLSGTTTYYCVTQQGFSVSTSSAYGIIRGRRVR